MAIFWDILRLFDGEHINYLVPTVCLILCGNELYETLLKIRRV
jgi:hypothetical protein